MAPIEQAAQWQIHCDTGLPMADRWPLIGTRQLQLLVGMGSSGSNHRFVSDLKAGGEGGAPERQRAGLP